MYHLVLLAAQAADPAAISAHAAALMKLGRHAEAAVLYQQLTRRLPAHAGMHMNLGLARFSAHDYAGSIPPLEAATRLDPKLFPAWLTLGIAHWKLDRPALAIPPLERALALAPADRIARIELADAYLATGQPGKASAGFRALIVQEPSHIRAWQGLGLAYAAEARAAFAQLETLAPDSAYWHVLFARSRLEQNQLRSAFVHFRRALERQPGLRGVHLHLAVVYDKAGHAEWAAIEKRREEALAPPDCARAQAECTFARGDYDSLVRPVSNPDAASLYWRSLAFSILSEHALARIEALPPGPAILELRARAAALRGDHRAAASLWEQAWKLTPAAERLRLEVARSLWRARQCEMARPHLDGLASSFSGHAGWNHLQGDCLLGELDPERALPYLEKAVLLDPDLLSARAALGRAYVRLNRPAEAAVHLEKAIPIDEDGSLRLQLARALERAGRAALASKWLDEFKAFSQSGRNRAAATGEDYQITPP